jgi:hypothetical protein
MPCGKNSAIVTIEKPLLNALVLRSKAKNTKLVHELGVCLKKSGLVGLTDKELEEALAQMQVGAAREV